MTIKARHFAILSSIKELHNTNYDFQVRFLAFVFILPLSIRENIFSDHKEKSLLFSLKIKDTRWLLTQDGYLHKMATYTKWLLIFLMI